MTSGRAANLLLRVERRCERPRQGDGGTLVHFRLLRRGEPRCDRRETDLAPMQTEVAEQPLYARCELRLIHDTLALLLGQSDRVGLTGRSMWAVS